MEREVFLIYLFIFIEVSNNGVGNNVNSTFSIRKFKEEEKLGCVRNSSCNEFSYLFQLDEFTHQTTCLFCDIFTSTALLYRFASYGFLSENERGQNKM